MILPRRGIEIVALPQPQAIDLALAFKDQRRTVRRLLPTAAVSPSLAKSTIRALQTTFWSVFRFRDQHSNPSRSALLIEIRSIVLIGPDSQV
ncbi:hypothetical protein CQ10_18995 [Bradyrhizobium valentinum]|nr:hypothetical protein CQ10_18995 [Bradyrhizobium valentinum]